MMTATRVSRNITAGQYSKMIASSCVTSLGFLAGLTLGGSRRARKIFIPAACDDTAHQLQIPPVQIAGAGCCSGCIAKKGAKPGVETPANTRTALMVSKTEAKERPTAPANLGDAGLKLRREGQDGERKTKRLQAVF